MSPRRSLLFPLAALLPSVAMPAAVLAQDEPAPIPNPEGFAEVRERFENLTPAEVTAAGYVAEPVCVSHPEAGGMGVHAINAGLMEAQFPTAEMDPNNPPILLLSADHTRVVGLEWEAKDLGQGEMELFGQTVTLQPGHPGVPEPHYMLHAYFRPDGHVLFAAFDPELSCPPTPNTAYDAPTSPGGLVPVLAGGLLLVLSVSLAWSARRRAS